MKIPGDKVREAFFLGSFLVSKCCRVLWAFRKDPHNLFTVSGACGLWWDLLEKVFIAPGFFKEESCLGKEGASFPEL